jgi:hypothetical protein
MIASFGVYRRIAKDGRDVDELFKMGCDKLIWDKIVALDGKKLSLILS